jgi:hypothetical protein
MMRDPRSTAASVRTRGVAGVVLAALVLALVTATAAPARADVGLGGNIGWPNGATFPFVAGETSRIRVSAFVQNLGSADAVIELLTDLPDEILLEAVGDTEITLRPLEIRTIDMDIVVESFVAPGSYPVAVTIRQSNVPPADGGGVALVPAISGRFVAEVVGSAPLLTVNAVSSEDALPITGELSLAFLGERGPLTLEEVVGSKLERRVIPGDYLVRFRIPGITQVEERVTVLEGQDRVVTLEVSGVQFLAVRVDPVREDDRIVAVALSASIRNQLREIEGPVFLTVEVDRSGERIDTFEVSRLPSLPSGVQEQRSLYRPPGGFTTGTWTFTFILSSDNFSITADAVAEIEIAAPGSQTFQSRFVIGMLLILSALVFAVARRRLDEEPDTMAAEWGSPRDP